MNIQASVTIWTALCFLLTALILHNWLFRPVLKLLDGRKAALSAARAKKEDCALRKLRREEALKKQREERRERLREEAEREAEKLKAESRQRLKDAQSECLGNIELCRERLQEDCERIVAAASPQMKDAAAVLAEKITSDRT